MDFKNKKISVIGLARSGQAAAKKLHKLGAKVFLSDNKQASQLELDKKILTTFNIETGGHTKRILDSDLIVVSPGVPSELPIFQNAREKNIPIWSELELGFQLIKNNRTKIIAVTGSNGKSTTVSLIYHIFKRVGKNVILAGNIGKPITGFPIDTRDFEFIVLEVSSFQLENIVDFKPDISVLLNLTPDHINRHGTVENYYKAKSKIFSNQTGDDIAIVDSEDEEVMELACHFPVKKMKYSLKSRMNNYVNYEDDLLTISDQHQSSVVLDRGELPLPGEHNLRNIFAASLVGVYSGLRAKQIKQGVKSFSTLEHRLEMVDEINGIKFVNDSKATNGNSVFYAIQSFEQPINLIMGGSEKNEDFTFLKKPIQENVKNLIILGETASKLKSTFNKAVPIIEVNNLEEAVKKGFEIAEKNEFVLLSPGCASFDMFENFEDRGKQFKKFVKNLK